MCALYLIKSYKHGFRYTPLRGVTSSTLDLAFCNPELAIHHESSVLWDLHGNCYCLVNLHISTPSPVLSRHPNWIIGHADWAGFSHSLTRKGPGNFIKLHAGVFCKHSLCITHVHNISPGHPPDFVVHLSFGGLVTITIQLLFSSELRCFQTCHTV